MNWINELFSLLCQMYKELGGDCEDLGSNPTIWVDRVVALYATKGPPTFDDSVEAAEFEMLLDQLEALLASPDNSLPESATQSLQNLINSLRSSPKAPEAPEAPKVS